jgi:hypothetical protein
VIDVPGGSGDFVPVILFRANGGDNQLWELFPTGETDGSGNPFVFIVNKHSALGLTVPKTPQFDQGAAVFQAPVSRGVQADAQKWLQFSLPTAPGAFIFSNKHSAMVLDVKGAAIDINNGTPIIQFPANLNPTQLWTLE